LDCKMHICAQHELIYIKKFTYNKNGETEKNGFWSVTFGKEPSLKRNKGEKNGRREKQEKSFKSLLIDLSGTLDEANSPSRWHYLRPRRPVVHKVCQVFNFTECIFIVTVYFFCLPSVFGKFYQVSYVCRVLSITSPNMGCLVSVFYLTLGKAVVC
jgi:hypothetical protein